MQAAALGIVGDVGKLILEVGCVADSMSVVAGLPDFAFELFSDGVRVSAFDALCASLKGLVFSWSYQDVDVFGHDGEAVQKITALVSVMEQGINE